MPCKSQHPAQPVLALTTMPLTALVFDYVTMVTHPLHKPAQKQTFLAKREQLVHNLPIKKPEIGHPIAQLDATKK